MITPNSFGALLRALLTALDSPVQAFYDEAGEDFRPRYFPFVRRLAQGDAAGVSELARIARVSQPAATQALAELLRMGLVERCEADDARLRMLQLSPAGYALAQRLAPAWRAIERAADELDGELAAPLGEVLRGALAALEREPFGSRIRRHLV